VSVNVLVIFARGRHPEFIRAIRTIFTDSLQELGLDLLPQVDATIVEEEGDASGLLVEAARYVLDAGLDDLLEAGVFDRARISQAIVCSAGLRDMKRVRRR
jgi:hypothetical protein